MSTEKVCPVGIVEKASELADEAEGYDLPDDYAPMEGATWEMERARVRHEHTNYTDLLENLPACLCFEDDWVGCDDGCPMKDKQNLCCCTAFGPGHDAHDIIMSACNSPAEEVLREWTEKRKKGEDR